MTGLDWNDENIRCPVDDLTFQSTADDAPVEPLLIVNITAEQVAAEKDPQTRTVLQKVLEAQKRWGLSPGTVIVTDEECASTEVDNSAQEDVVFDKIAAQGEKIRELKTKKADKQTIDSEVKILLALKVEYKTLTGKDWIPQKQQTAPAVAPNLNNETDLLNKITAQGDIVRDLKTKKADKPTVEAAVKILLALKAEFKSVTGKDWKPGTVGTPVASTPVASSVSENELLNKITAQGDTVRDLKAKKADKSTIEGAVKILLTLKAEYKTLTGKDWKPTTAGAPTPVTFSGGEAALSNKISAQGDKIRDLKSQKADKAAVETEVKILLALKGEYKTLTAKDWKPSALTPTSDTCAVINSEATLLNKIAEQGDIVRKLKSEKADKTAIDAAVKSLLNFKADYKTLTGRDWKSGTQPCPPQTSKAMVDSSGDIAKDSLAAKITEQGNIVRTLKTSGGAKVKTNKFLFYLISCNFFPPG